LGRIEIIGRDALTASGKQGDEQSKGSDPKDPVVAMDGDDERTIQKGGVLKQTIIADRKRQFHYIRHFLR
jgi:hypothetical protein